MARPRTPTEILELRGAFQANPSRRRPATPKSNKELGLPPKGLTDIEQACWAEIVTNIPPGVLTAGDRVIVEVIARLMAKLRTEGLSAMKSAELNLLLNGLGRCGMTPADRSRVFGLPATPERSAWDALQ